MFEETSDFWYLLFAFGYGSLQLLCSNFLIVFVLCMVSPFERRLAKIYRHWKLSCFALTLVKTETVICLCFLICLYEQSSTKKKNVNMLLLRWIKLNNISLLTDTIKIQCYFKHDRTSDGNNFCHPCIIQLKYFHGVLVQLEKHFNFCRYQQVHEVDWQTCKSQYIFISLAEVVY